MRFAVDTGGTFTDLVIEDDDGVLSLHKSSTVPSDPVEGILNAFAVAADALEITREELLGRGDALIHGTTRGLNAVLTGVTARTAFLTTEGHRDVLLLREGGRTDIFDYRQPYPDPYVPRSLTFEVPERVGSEGQVLEALDERAVERIIDRMVECEVEAVAVCLLWSIVNPVHELRIGAMLRESTPDLFVTLSHELNPCLREYRRASSAAIDASLKPVMSEYVSGLRDRLADAGFTGRTLIVTSSGGALDAADVAAAPIHSLNSGPAMAPVAGRYFAQRDAEADMAIVADTGGTSYDVSVVRRGRIPWTRESWLGRPYVGHMTGLPSVDVRSVGAGGGSIAHVDEGGLLHVGPQSAGAAPGPVAYGRGGDRPTMTDACLVLGFLDPTFFLGGRTVLDLDAARAALTRDVADPLALSVEEAAAAVYRVATERMVSAIEEITVHEGIDPGRAALIGGGGAAGFNSVAIARQLGCPEVVIPAIGPGLSAAGALISDLSRSFEIADRSSDRDFDFERAGSVLRRLEERANAFITGPGSGAVESRIEFSVEARYPAQAWELEVPLASGTLETPADLDRLRNDFHALHRDVFAIADPSSPIEFDSWHARARCRLSDIAEPVAVEADASPTTRRIHHPRLGAIEVPVWRVEGLPVGKALDGPAIIEAPTSTVVVDPEARFQRRATGSLHIEPVRVGRAATEATAAGTGA
jgi:N-methylhydantoinase A